MQTALRLCAAALLSAMPLTASLANGHYSTKDTPFVDVTPVWSGLHFGLAAGYEFGTTDTSRRVFLNAADFALANDFDATSHDNVDVDGFTGTLTLGYDMHAADYILGGVFGEYTFGSLEGTDTWTDPRFGTRTFKIEMGNHQTFAVGGRIGFLTHPAVMLHVNAGYASTNLKLSAPASGSTDETLHGYFVGLGLVYHLRDRLGLTFDYRYTDYDDTNLVNVVTQNVGAGRLCCIERIDVDPDIHSFRLGLTYRMPRHAPIVHETYK